MRFVTFETEGGAERFGFLSEVGRVVDLEGACASALAAELPTERAYRLAAAMAPPDALAFVEGGEIGLWAARKAKAAADAAARADRPLSRPARRDHRLLAGGGATEGPVPPAAKLHRLRQEFRRPPGRDAAVQPSGRAPDSERSSAISVRHRRPGQHGPLSRGNPETRLRGGDGLRDRPPRVPHRAGRKRSTTFSGSRSTTTSARATSASRNTACRC